MKHAICEEHWSYVALVEHRTTWLCPEQQARASKLAEIFMALSLESRQTTTQVGLHAHSASSCIDDGGDLCKRLES